MNRSTSTTRTTPGSPSTSATSCSTSPTGSGGRRSSSPSTVRALRRGARALLGALAVAGGGFSVTGAQGLDLRGPPAPGVVAGASVGWGGTTRAALPNWRGKCSCASDGHPNLEILSTQPLFNTLFVTVL